jgi:DNA-binding Xre family transcriptional regulator
MKNYKKLRAAMLMKDVKMRELADLIGRSPSSMSFMLSGKMQINLYEAYAICDRLGIPLSNISEYFDRETVNLVPNYMKRDNKTAPKKKVKKSGR